MRRNNLGDDQSDSIETSGFSDDEENEDLYNQDEESAPMAPVQGWDVFEVSQYSRNTYVLTYLGISH